ncbi:MAG: transposase [Planctomycetota bacterium]
MPPRPRRSRAAAAREGAPIANRPAPPGRPSSRAGRGSARPAARGRGSRRPRVPRPRAPAAGAAANPRGATPPADQPQRTSGRSKPEPAIASGMSRASTSAEQGSGTAAHKGPTLSSERAGPGGQKTFPARPLAGGCLPPIKRLRCFLSNRPEAVSALTKIFLAEIERLLTAAAGMTSGPAARPRLGAISFLHRFGSALNHHVHLHACVTDGVFMPRAAGAGFR